jgi:hypothetical protein
VLKEAGVGAVVFASAPLNEGKQPGQMESEGGRLGQPTEDKPSHTGGPHLQVSRNQLIDGVFAVPKHFSPWCERTKEARVPDTPLPDR